MHDLSAMSMLMTSVFSHTLFSSWWTCGKEKVAIRELTRAKNKTKRNKTQTLHDKRNHSAKSVMDQLPCNVGSHYEDHKAENTPFADEIIWWTEVFIYTWALKERLRMAKSSYWWQFLLYISSPKFTKTYTRKTIRNYPITEPVSKFIDFILLH